MSCLIYLHGLVKYIYLDVGNKVYNVAVSGANICGEEISHERSRMVQFTFNILSG